MKIGFIDYFLDEWHANNYPKWIQEASDGEIEVAYAYGLIDHPRSGRTTAQWCADFGVERCMSIEEIVEKSDALIVLSPDNAEMHEGLCQIPLRSGKRCYVDKTFAPDDEVAGRIFAVAEAFGTPCYTSSALRFADEYRSFDTDGIESVASWGPGKYETYVIHQLEPLSMLMKTPAEKVLIQPAEKALTMLIVYTDGRTASVTCYAEGAPFMMNIAKKGKNTVLDVRSDFFHHFIVDMVDFFRTGEIKVSHEETMEIMRLRASGIRALRTPGEWVRV